MRILTSRTGKSGNPLKLVILFLLAAKTCMNTKKDQDEKQTRGINITENKIVIDL